MRGCTGRAGSRAGRWLPAGGKSRTDCNSNGFDDDLEFGPFEGHALLFNGVDARAYLGSPAALSGLGQGEFTLETWVRTSDTGRGVLIGNHDEYHSDYGFWSLELHDSAPAGHVRLAFGMGVGAPDTHDTDVTVANGAWHHVAAVRTPGVDGSVRIYIDGGLVYDEPAMGAYFYATSGTTIGHQQTFPLYFDGALDEARVWNVARDGVDIAADMYTVLDGTESGLVAYWRFEEGAGDTAFDSAGDNDGALFGPPAWLPQDPDCNENGIPDKCESDEDCNDNGVQDFCDIAAGTSSDCNTNGVPDECEELPTGVLYVDDDASAGLNDGSSWADAYLELADAVPYASCPDVTEVRVAQGTYKPGTLREDTFQLVSGGVIRGGYRGLSGGGDPDDRDFASFPTILSGDIGIEGDNSDNSYHVVTGSGTDATAVLDGVAITGGNADGGDGQWYGGGMYNGNGSPTLTNCTFSGNAATYGGGMYNHWHSSSTLANCIVWGNTASIGPQIHNDASTTTATYSCIQGDSVWPGAGNINTDPLFVRAPDDGGDGWGDDPDTPGVDESANDDYGDVHLLVDSPCIDAGDNGAVPPDTFDLDNDGDTAEPLPIDLDRRLRFADWIDTVDTGLPHPSYPDLPIVDMGAYEYQLTGDLDGDGDVDVDDFNTFAACMAGPDVEPPGGCTAADLDGDTDVDLADLALFQQWFTGP